VETVLIFTEWKFKVATLLYMTIIFLVFVAAPAYLLSTPIASYTEQIRFLSAYNIQLDIVIFILFLWFGSIPIVYWGTVIRWQQHRNYILEEEVKK
jgi:hypothetical protein